MTNFITVSRVSCPQLSILYGIKIYSDLLKSMHSFGKYVLSTYYVPNSEDQVVSKIIHLVFYLRGRQMLNQFIIAYINRHMCTSTRCVARSVKGGLLSKL